MSPITLTIFWILIGIILFPVILKNKAPYGRHSSKKWGKTIKNKTGWILMELPALLVCPIFYFLNTSNLYSLNTFFILLWVLHYTNRTIIYPLRIKTKGKKMPFLIAISAIIFNVVNGFINGYFLSITSYQNHHYLLLILGLVLFMTGFIINIKSDNKLIGLRSKSEENKYVLPKGGLFRYISCPNFFGELVEWFGFALMTFNIGSLSFFMWTFINLVPRALSHHKWYNENFNDYPKNRKAIIPKLI
jgi:protein-S-isoprenylcysteine O-methyltransferase Ste14